MPTYIALKRDQDMRGQIELVVYQDETVIHVEEGDQYVTIQTKIELFED